ncbi:MAG: pseudouridine synthase [bacterium]|nr:pseudouridine synthase [bacterium]
MSAKYQNATKQFFEASRDCSVEELVCEHLNEQGNVALKAGGVWLERKRIEEPKTLLQAGDTLRVYLSPIQSTPYALDQNHIVYEDEHLLVINKPAAVSACADRACTTYNVTYGVEQLYKSREMTYCPVPINRLDFMVQGLMLFAKSKPDELALFKLSQARQIHKYYNARLEPMENPPKYCRIKDKLAFTNKCNNDENGKPSESLFIYKGRHNNAEHYGIVLLTGRRHQIRFHAATYLAPILNDSLYGPNADATDPIALTASALNFNAFGKRYRFRINP